MPKKLPAAEEKLLRFYIKEGAAEETIPVVAKRFKMTLGDVKKKLALKRVQEALRERMEPIRLEQQKQQMLADAVEQVTAKLTAEIEKAESELKAATEMPIMAVTGNEKAIEHELMRLVRLDPEKHGRIKLASIQTAFVVAGLMEQGTTRRVNPVDKEPTTGAAGVYSSIFDSMRQQSALPAEVVEVVADDAVYDLTPPQPGESSQAKIEDVRMPVAGESIDMVPVVRPSRQARVITVEVG